jgi:hypothetical protein
MATEKTLRILMESREFGALDAAAQRDRLVQFIADWFDPGHKLDTVDHVRLTARLRTHAAKSQISVGEVMEIILPSARRLHAQSVIEAERDRIMAEDAAADTSKHTDSTPEPDREPELTEVDPPQVLPAKPRSRRQHKTA